MICFILRHMKVENSSRWVSDINGMKPAHKTCNTACYLTFLHLLHFTPLQTTFPSATCDLDKQNKPTT